MNEARRPRLILLKQFFDPEPTIKGLKFAQRLSALGFDVEVVTGFPNYPGGKIYDGYRIRPIRREVQGDVTVTRLALYPSHSTSRVGRVLNYASFGLSALLYLLFFARRADVIYAYHPPLTVGLAATIASLFRRSPVLLDIQDLWPDTLKATGMVTNARILGLIGRAGLWTYRRASHITVLSNGFCTKLAARGVPASKISVVHNWADEDAMSPPQDGRLSAPSDRFKVLFAGNIGKAQGLDVVLDAAALLNARRADIEFCFLGAGLDRERLQKRACDMNLDNVQFRPRVPMGEVGAQLTAADCLLVHLKADPLFEITIPSKAQAYLAAGKPILMAVAGDAADLIRRSGGGVVAPSDNPQALADAVEKLADTPKEELAAMGTRGRDYYFQELSFERGTQAFADEFQRLAARPRASAAKRAFDVIAASIGLLALSPLLLFIALAVRVETGSPILFRQQRPGLDGRPFEMLKFRTMREAEGGGSLSPSQRVTHLGRFLRATSLDELPQLWNVLKGDMSLVGPRPLLMDYLPLYSPQQARRHAVRPGLTGWAQVKGRNAIDWDRKLALDVWYVENRSFWLDLRILARTVWRVAARAGVNRSETVTMPRFTGGRDGE